MDEREEQKRRERSDTIWTFIMIAAFITVWPAGIVIAVLRSKHLLPLLGMNTPTGTEPWRTAQAGSAAAGNPAPHEPPISQSVPPKASYAKADYNKTGYTNPGYTNPGGAHTPPRPADWEQQARQQEERIRKQALYWAEQAKQQAQRTKERAVQWAAAATEQAQQAADQFKAGQQPRQAQSQRKPEQQAWQTNQWTQPQAAPWSPQNQAKAARRKFRKLRFGRATFGFGLVLGGFSLLTLVKAFFSGYSIFVGFPLFGVLALGVYLAILGLVRTKQSKRLLEYAALINPNTIAYSIHALADQTGRSYRQVLSDLRKMIELGFWDQAWIDQKRGRLMFGEYADAQSEPEPAPAAPEEPPAPKGDRAEQVLQRIRADNDLIKDEEMSRKIDRIELLTGEIFRYLSKHPEREGELRTFMDYYLPQTLKILETYAQLEAQGVQTENICKAKTQISGMLDQLTESYERQLDKLFDTDVLDISADIEVMRQMLRSDGLTPDELELEPEKLQR